MSTTFSQIRKENSLILIIEHTVTIPLEIRVCDLGAELRADALIIFVSLHTAGAIATGTLQAFLDGFHYLLVFVQTNSHHVTSFLYYYKYRWGGCQCCLLGDCVVY